MSLKDLELSLFDGIYWLSPLAEPVLGHLQDKEVKSLAVTANVLYKSKILDILPPENISILCCGYLLFLKLSYRIHSAKR